MLARKHTGEEGPGSKTATTELLGRPGSMIPLSLRRKAFDLAGIFLFQATRVSRKNAGDRARDEGIFEDGRLISMKEDLLGSSEEIHLHLYGPRMTQMEVR